MAWRGLIVKKWTKIDLVRSSNTTWSRYRLNPYQQQVRCFRREAKRPETKKKSNIEQETKVSPNENTLVPPRNPRPSLFKPLVFTLGFTGCSFAVAAIVTYENTRSRLKKESDKFSKRSVDLKRAPSSKVENFWRRLTNKQKALSGIIALNLAVLCCWKIPSISLRRNMIKYFTSNPVSKTPCLPLVLSTFSHNSAMHMVANMYALWILSSSVVSFLGKEQFMAFYLSAGVVSSMVSYVCKTATGRFYPSLGASGAVMAMLAAICTQFPEGKLSLIFLPMVTLKAGSVLKALVAFNATGLFLGWKFFDHAAHLGGALFGLWYVADGRRLIWGRRKPFVKLWHSLRSKDTGEGRPGAPPGGGPG